MLGDLLRPAIPIVYYHSIADHAAPRPFSYLSLPVHVFEEQLRRLQSSGFCSVFLDDVYSYVSGERMMSRPEIALTFDDGFLDNWVIAWPLAKKLGIRFTVFVSPEFVDPRDIVRPTLEDVWAGRCSEDELDWWGYLSWREMREMEASSLVDIQSHALTHAWYPVSSTIVDYHRPGASYYWAYWNHAPESKPYWLTRYDDHALPYGHPIYEHRKALVARRYQPDPAVQHALTRHVADHGGARFFAAADWRETLDRVASTAKAVEDRFESEAARLARVRHELDESKAQIERALDKQVRYLCWPGGGDSSTAQQQALAAGYRATTSGKQLNRPGADPTRLHRVSAWFGFNVPDALKWVLFDGQLDRSRNRPSVQGFVTWLLAEGHRVLGRYVLRGPERQVALD